MSKILQFRRGTTSEVSAITGAAGELFVDLTKATVVVMDGSTQGGVALATSSDLGAYAPLASPSFTGTVSLQQTTELLNVKSAATGTVNHDFSTGAIWYHSAVAANFTPNFINVPTTNNRTIVVSLIISQGSTPYYPSALQIGGTSQTIKWLDSTTPTATASKVEVYSFSLIRVQSSWIVLGSQTTFG